MRDLAPMVCVVASAVVIGAASPLPAQSSPTPVCALLSVAEIRETTGRADYPDYVDGDPEGEGAGGGSSCQYGGPTIMPGGYPPLLSVVLIRGKNWTAQSREFTLPAGCEREQVAGVGDDAFFESCPASRLKRSPPLYVKVGANDLIVQMDVDLPATQAAVRPIVIAVARAAASKLR